MKETNRRILNQIIKNETNRDKFIGDVLMYELNNLEDENLDKNNCHLFKSARHKNDLPSVATFSKFDEAMEDCLVSLQESGLKIKKNNTKTIISDHLTILGQDNDALLIGFLGGKKHLIRVEINIDENANFLSLKVYAEINKTFKPNETFKTEDILITHTNNVNDSITKWAKLKSHKKYQKKDPICVYTTWYYYGSTINFEDVKTNLDMIQKKNLLFDAFQIDDGWEKELGEWIPNKKFPTLKEVSNEIKNYGLIPGIWTAPFVAHKSCSIWKLHPDWKLRNNKNKPCKFNVNGRDFLIIDITIPETWEYFKSLYQNLTFVEGFKYHKLDFTRAPLTAKSPIYKNKYITPVEAYRNACLAIREGMGEESFFLMCGGLYDPLIGICDAQRTGSDVLSMWSKQSKRGGKALPYTMKQNSLRYYMNNWWLNDADALMIRENKIKERHTELSLGLLTDDEVKTCVLNQLISGGNVCISEPLNKISDDRLNNLYHILPIKKVEVEIPDILSSERYPNIVKIKGKNSDGCCYLIYTNFSSEKRFNPSIKFKDFLDFKKDEKLTIADFYNQVIYDDINGNEQVTQFEIPSNSSNIFKLVKNKNMKKINNKRHYIF